MQSTKELSRNLSSQLPFKTDQNIIKSDWKSSIWGRKQVRIKVESSGELTIQTIAQNAFARLASKFLKFISCNTFKSVGKKVQSFTFAGYALPSNLSIPLSEQKHLKLMEIQSKQLALFFLPSHKKLSDLGSELIEIALRDPENCDQTIRAKIIDMCQEILDFQLLSTEEFQKDLSPAELYAKLQEYERQTEIFCKEFPIILKDFIEKNNQEKAAIRPVETPGFIISKQKYLTLLDLAKAYAVELKDRLQFTSADWLEREIAKTIEKLANEEEHPLSLKLAIESLEDALDCIEEDADHAAQLQALPIDSPYEQTLKDLVISEIRQTLAEFSEDLEATQKEVIWLFKNTNEGPLYQNLLHFFEASKLKAKMLAEKHDSFESWIPGLEAGRHWMNPWLGNNDPLINLENLDRNRLITHKIHVDNYCAETLDFIENETQVEKILKLIPQYEKLNARASLKMDQLPEDQYLHKTELEKIKNDHEKSIANIASSLSSSTKCLRYVKTLEKAIDALQNKLDEIEKNPEMDPIEQLIGLKTLESPLYDVLRMKLIDHSKIQLTAYVEILNHYQEILSAAIPILKENNPNIMDNLLELENAIKAKISEGQALTVDFATRLHFWELFRSEVAVEDLPPLQLKGYLNKVSRLVLTGIEDIIQKAAYSGIKFD